jgi:hypothetical protein
MGIHVLDVTDHSVKALEDSDGLWSPRWSPDGSFIFGSYKEQPGIENI